MAQTAHTPGPWSLDKEEPTIVWSIKDGQAPLICDTAASPITLLSLKEAVANAALIAAAPDLLAALQEIAEGVGRYSKDPLTHAENCIEDMKLIARLAIAKATISK